MNIQPVELKQFTACGGRIKITDLSIRRGQVFFLDYDSIHALEVISTEGEKFNAVVINHHGSNGEYLGYTYVDFFGIKIKQ